MTASALPVRASEIKRPDALYTDLEWEVHPEGLTRTLLWVKERYGGHTPLHHRERGGVP